ncbi:MAG: ABC transporter permease [Anaerolineaceae bacterium]|nr:ABC transporter permease [Anaerolineaceae bacterium]
MKTMGSQWKAWLIVVFFFVLWEGMTRALQVPVYILPSPGKVFQTLWQNPITYLDASMLTIGEALAGLVLGVIAGFLLASLLILSPGLEDGVMTLAILVKSTPLVAIAPLLTIWLGFGVLPKIVITALLTFFPVLVNILSGLQKVDPALIDLYSTLNASKWEIFLRLRIPTSLSYLFAALKISAPLALIGAVVAEWTGASGGLGRIMWLAYTNLNLPFMFAAILILAFVGMVLFRILDQLEKKLVFWQFEEGEDL